jgi:O-antigen/teichoic acid export membrane protein
VGGSLLAGPIVRLLFGIGYTASAAPFAILIWAIPLNLLRDVPLMALLSAEGEHWVFRVTLASAVLNLLLNVALIPHFGLVGAASATVLTEAVRMALAAWVARRKGFHLPGPRRFVKAGVASLAMAGCLLLSPNAPVWIGVPMGGIVYLAVLTGLGGIRLGGGRKPVLSV